jgi:hypothetical protein
MKKLILFAVSLTVIGLMSVSCGGSGNGSAKNAAIDTLVIKNGDYVALMTCPKGFFSVSDNKEDFINKNDRGPVYIGKDFTMQGFIQTNPYDDFAAFKKAQQSNNVADIKGDGIEGFSYRVNNKTLCLFDFNAGVGKGPLAYIILVPNEQKNPTVEELNDTNSKKAFREKCDKMMQSKEVQDMIKTLKIGRAK